MLSFSCSQHRPPLFISNTISEENISCDPLWSRDQLLKTNSYRRNPQPSYFSASSGCMNHQLQCHNPSEPVCRHQRAQLHPSIGTPPRPAPARGDAGLRLARLDIQIFKDTAKCRVCGYRK
jgi:hypothetical protein